MATNNNSTQKLTNELEKAVDEAKKLLKVFDETEKVTKEIAEELKDAFKNIDKKTSKGIIEFNKALKETNQLTEDSEKLQQAKIKTEGELIKKEKLLSSARILETKEKEELHKLEQARNKTQIEVRKERERRLKLAKKQREELEKEAKALKRLNSSYSQQSKKLTELRNEYKDTFIQTEKNRKGLKKYVFGFTKAGRALNKLGKEVNQLDEDLKELDESVGQNQRSVGKYEKAVKGLNSVIGKLGIAAVITKGVQLLTGAFGDSRNGALLMEQAMNTLTGTISVTIGRLTTAAVSIRKLFDEAKGGLDTITALGSSISILLNGFDGIGKQVSKTVDNLNTVSKITQKYNIEIQALQRSISLLNTSQVIQAQIAENDTISFQLRVTASKLAVKQAIELGAIQEELAKKELDKQVKTIATQLEAKGVSVDVEKATADQIKTLLAAVDAEGKFTNAKKISGETEQAFTDAFVSNQDVQLESAERVADVLEKQNVLYNDRAQAILDVQVDGLDNQKTINERVIANEKETFDKRKDTLDKTNVLFEKGFQAQKATLLDLNDRIISSERKRIDSSSLLTAEQKKAQLTELNRQQLVLTSAKIDKIVAEQDATIQADQILALELNEKTIIDLLSVIRDYRTGKQDLLETEQDYNDTLVEQAELQSEILEQEKALSGETTVKTFDENQLDRDIEAATKRRDATAKNTTARLKAQKELNELLLEQQREYDEEKKKSQDKIDNDLEEAKAKKDEKELQDEKDKLAKRKQLLEDSVQVFDSILSKSRDKQNRDLDAEIDTLDDRIDDVNNAIGLGNAEAKQSLTELEEQKRQAEAKKEELRKKEVRDLKLIAGLELLAANSDSPNAVGKTLGDVALLIAGLDSFFEGTENTGTVANPLDSNGGRVAILHDNERVITADQNKKIGGLSNEDLADVASMHNKGALNGGTTVIQQNNQELIQEVKEMTKAVKSIPIQNYNYDAKGKYHEQVLDSKNKRERIKSRANNIFK